MTDRDNIELPPLPRADFSYSTEAMERYGRAAVLADRERRAEQAQPAKPKVHRTRVELLRNDYGWKDLRIQSENPPAIVTLCWTDDGRAWIESERNRELAQWLRSWRGQVGNEAADALDGGVR